MAFISKIKAGDFNIEVKIQSPTTSQNTFGEKAVSSYSTQATVWANKNVSSLRNINEKFEGDKLQSYSEFYILVRYEQAWVDNINGTWRLQDNSTNEIYEILSYIIDPRKEFVEFRTKLDVSSLT